jgi:hypothetical protein
MIPIGYMAKRICVPPPALGLSGIVDIYSVNDCVNDNFADYVNYWRHNGYWFFDSPEVIRQVARENAIDLEGTKLFYYEAYELEFDGQRWKPFAPWDQMPLSVESPSDKSLEGFDVIVVWTENSPEPAHSPLSCNCMARELRTNTHCLFETFVEAETNLNLGAFAGCDRGNLRIIAVYSADWPTNQA